MQKYDGHFMWGKKRSLVTYHPVVNQRIYRDNQQLIANKPYAQFLSKEMYVYDEEIGKLQAGPLAEEDMLRLHDINRLLDEGYLSGETGYGQWEDGSLYSSSLTYFPNCTAEMFKWWFGWHVAESERYALWYPYAHIATRTPHRNMASVTGLTSEECYIGSTHFITEYLFSSRNKIAISFIDPSSIGLDTSRFEAARIMAHACGVVYLQRPHLKIGTMIHLVRETFYGFELRSRYYLGHDMHLKMGKVKMQVPRWLRNRIINCHGGIELAYEQALHDQMEFTHLASFLPELFKRFGP